MDFFEKRSPHLPLSFSLRTLYPIASYLQQILRHGTVALKMLSLMRLISFSYPRWRYSVPSGRKCRDRPFLSITGMRPPEKFNTSETPMVKSSPTSNVSKP
ncbi:hypothetical protein TNCV_547311 [Trichonephila clavipes]|nr:hypothetical protein TNCV_547311 [Trichonephila clavipes]